MPSNGVEKQVPSLGDSPADHHNGWIQDGRERRNALTEPPPERLELLDCKPVAFPGGLGDQRPVDRCYVSLHAVEDRLRDQRSLAGEFACLPNERRSARV